MLFRIVSSHSSYFRYSTSFIRFYTMKIQETCPPCRQSMKLYDDSVFVEFEDKKVYVCCIGCANKMEMYWNGYLKIMKEELQEYPEKLENNINPLKITNKYNKPVCEPCKGGLCTLRKHLPPEAIKD